MVLGVDEPLVAVLEQRLKTLGRVCLGAPVQARAALGVGNVHHRPVVLGKHLGRLREMTGAALFVTTTVRMTSTAALFAASFTL